MDQNQTPIFDSLLEYFNRDTVPFHVPGHKRGEGMDNKFKDFIGNNILSIDVTIFQLVDSLHHPTGSILEAMKLAADANGADMSFISMNGTSGAIQAMIMSVVGEGDKIIVPRNVHKSVTAGIILSGATPIFMQPEIDKNLGIAHGVTPLTVENALKANPDAKAVLVINPTYYGVATNIKKIAEIVHSYDIPLIVDEAHGPHLKFNDKLPISSLEAGADICAQSTHKIIGAMTQASFLHVKAGRVSISKVQSMLNLLQSTSPSYPIMASLDVARMQIATKGQELLDNAIELANYARAEINKIPGLYCFGDEIIGQPGVVALDPCKITITCKGLGLTGYELDHMLADNYHVQLELSDLYNALAVGSLGDTKENMDKLINALKDISSKYYGTLPIKGDVLDIPTIPNRSMTPREAFNREKVSMKLNESVGHVSGEFLLAYPPGIPIVCPGEIITQEIIDYVQALKDANLYVQGTEDPTVETINVVK